MAVITERDFGGTAKFQSLCEQLGRLAQQLGPGAKLPTVVELRQQMGVSVSTLNFALKELEAQNVLVRKHGVGIYVSSALHTKTICLIYDYYMWRGQTDSPFWTQLLDQAREGAHRLDGVLEVHFAQPWEVRGKLFPRGLTREIESGQVDGIIGVGLPRATALWIGEQNTPYVGIFGPPGGERSAEFHYSLHQVSRGGVEALANQGCKRLACIGNAPLKQSFPGLDETGLFDMAVAMRGEFVASVAEAGLEYEPSLHMPWALSADEISLQGRLSNREQGYRQAMALFDRPRSSWPDGILILDDHCAQGALQAMDQRGIQVDETLRIATQANYGSPTLEAIDADLTLLEYDARDLIRLAFESLDRLMSGLPVPERTTYLEAAVRQSPPSRTRTPEKVV